METAAPAEVWSEIQSHFSIGMATAQTVNPGRFREGSTAGCQPNRIGKYRCMTSHLPSSSLLHFRAAKFFNTRAVHLTTLPRGSSPPVAHLRNLGVGLRLVHLPDNEVDAAFPQGLPRLEDGTKLHVGQNTRHIKWVRWRYGANRRRYFRRAGCTRRNRKRARGVQLYPQFCLPAGWLCRRRHDRRQRWAIVHISTGISRPFGSARTVFPKHRGGNLCGKCPSTIRPAETCGGGCERQA